MNLIYQMDGFIITTDKSKLQIEVVHGFLKQSYWAKNIPSGVIEKAIQNSLCYGLFIGDNQIGFARVMTDYATFAYIADVFILEQHRGIGLSKWLMECILSHPELQAIRTWMLKTRDAHGLYSKFGFNQPEEPELIMEKKVVRAYPPRQ